MPGCWLYLVHTTWHVFDRDVFWGISGYTFFVETAVAGGFIYLLLNKAIWGVALVFFLHYVFWGAVMLRDGAFLAPVAASIPLSLVFPCCAGFAWLRCIRPTRPHESPRPHMPINSD